MIWMLMDKGFWLNLLVLSGDVNWYIYCYVGSCKDSGVMKYGCFVLMKEISVVDLLVVEFVLF